MNPENIPNNGDNKYELFPIINKLKNVNVDIVDIGNFDELPSDVADNLLCQAIPIIEKSFGQVYKKDLSDQDVIDFLTNGTLYLVLNNEKKVVGVELLQLITIEDVKIMYTGGVILYPEYQGKNIHSDFRSNMIERNKPNYVAGRTQSPIVYNIYCKSPGIVYPTYNTLVPDSIQKLASELSNSLGLTNFDPTTLIQKGAYGESIYSKDKYPTIDPNSDIGKLFSQLDIENGDAFLIIKKIEDVEEQEK